MYLRPAVWEDLPSIAEVAAQATLDDELFAFLCPRRRKYYSDDRFLRRLRTKLTSPGCVIVVAVEDFPTVNNNQKPSSIVGYGVWERIGKEGEESTRQWKESDESGWWNALQEKLQDVADHCVSRFHLDRSVDNALTLECFPFPSFRNLWYLSTLAVHPTYQRQGIGRSLVEWGLEQARREGTSVGLEASIKGTTPYEKLGFRTGNVMQLVQGITMRAMLWDI